MKMYILQLADQVFLCDQTAVIARQKAAPRCAANVLHVNAALTGYRAAMGDDRVPTFRIPDVAVVVNVAESTVQTLIRRGIIAPTFPGRRGRSRAARFDYRGAFACSVLSACQRQGAGYTVMRRIFKLLTSAGRDENYQPIRRRSTRTVSGRIPGAATTDDHTELPAHCPTTGRALAPAKVSRLEPAGHRRL